eukprot:CAMPEP_0184481568 /NCGR_PEP_ID=MMETSP0113_2-20130426/3121_1 /TAXON_ID=91329 /ORGANISM="Norrisiella sphaerica, Strain BC52" /LENGTH=400 /DNA_ID=CAMNT_0026860765 /DNA_START=339 /DNA_END=1541 /DNA_ORIENTATION=+
MASNILLRNNLIADFDKLAADIGAFPVKCMGTKNYLITDSIVDGLYGNLVMEKLKALGMEVYKLVIPSSSLDRTGDPSTEKSKTLDNFKMLTDAILKNGITKHSVIFSLGGGVVNNICGFIASTLYRGIGLVHITTTCMGMVDAAIDFKQAVNHCCGKNLLGAYYPACRILIDPTLLATQSVRAIRNGIAEAIKHGLCHSPDLLEFILSGWNKLKDPEYLETLIKMTVALKAPTLTHYNESNFNEMCPQYGHSVGHSLEFLSFHTEGQALLHGEAVAIGCCVSAEIAKIMRLCDQKTVDYHYTVFERMGLPVYVPEDQKIDDIAKQMKYDKHYAKKQVTMGLLTDIGTMHSKDGNFCFTIEDDVVRQALHANIRRRDSVKNMDKEYEQSGFKAANMACLA